MKVRFKEGYLVDEKGEIVEASFEDLVKACLSNSFDTLSISTIIFQGVAEVTQLKIIRSKDYGKSELYMMLEKAIQEDSNYKKAKTEREEQHIIAREARMKAARGAAIILSNPSVYKYARKRALARMRPYKNYHRGSH